MGQERYPKEVTKENLPQLAERAKKVKRKANIVLYSTSIVYSLVALFFAVPVFFLWGVFVIKTSPPMSSEEATTIIFVTFWVVYLVFLYFFLILVESSIRRIAKLKYEDAVFSECILIANSLVHNNKREAIREVDNFLSTLHIFQSSSGYNSKAKRYSPEIGALSRGKNQIKRMLLFSNENTYELFTNFGLALVNNDDPTAHRFIKHIIHEAERYGTMEGWLQKIQSKASNVNTILLSVSAAVGIIASILKLLGFY